MYIKNSIIVFLIIFIVFSYTSRDIGITWDEPIYLESAEKIRQYLTLLKKEKISYCLSDEILKKYFDGSQWTDVHPSFSKLTGSIPYILLKNKLGDIYSYRLGNIFLAALAFSFVYIWITNIFNSKLSGVTAVLLCISVPRVFGELQIGATDSTLYSLSILSAVSAYYSVRKKNILLNIITAVLCGFCFSSKFTGLFVPIGIFIWSYLYHRKTGGVNNLFFIPILVPLIFILTNPQFWHDSILRTLHYCLVSSSRHITEPHLSYIFFKLSPKSDWYYPFVYILTSIPVIILFFSIRSFFSIIKKLPENDFSGLIFIMFSLPVIIIILPNSIAYDGIRLFLSSFAFISLATVYSMNILKKYIRILLFTGIVSVLIITHPFYLEHYSLLIGGTLGAQKIGMETTYWWDAATPDFFKKTIKTIPENSSVSFFPIDMHLLNYYKNKYGNTINITEFGLSDYFIVMSKPACNNLRLHLFIRKYYQKYIPVMVYPSEQKPFMIVYKKI